MEKVILVSVSQNGLSLTTWLGGFLLLIALFTVLSVITVKTRRNLRLRRKPASYPEVTSGTPSAVEVTSGMSSATGNFDPGYDAPGGAKDEILPASILGGHIVEQANPEDQPSAGNEE